MTDETDIFSDVVRHHVGYAGSWIDRAEDMRKDSVRIVEAKTHPEARWLAFDDLRPVMTSGRELM